MSHLLTAFAFIVVIYVLCKREKEPKNIRTSLRDWDEGDAAVAECERILKEASKVD